MSALYRLMIVDDESIMRKGLRKTVDWNEMGFEVVGEADNGVMALEAVKRFLPDVILTDIKMPVMNGLELLSKLKDSYPHIKIVLLSGYEEFEYVRDGMRLGAEGYVLKLSFEDEIADVIKKVRLKLDMEKQQNSIFNSLINERKELVYRGLFQKVINGDVTQSDIAAILEKDKDIPLHQGVFCMICLFFEVVSSKPDEASENEAGKVLQDCLSSIDFKVCGAQEITLMQPGNICAVLYYALEHVNDSLYRRIIQKWSNFRLNSMQPGENTFHVRIRIGVGNQGKGWESIYPSFMQARKSSLLVTTDNPVSLAEWKDAVKASSKHILGVREQNELIQGIVAGNIDFVRQQLDNLIKRMECKELPLSIQDIQLFLSEFIILLKWKLHEFGIEMEEDINESLKIKQHIFNIHALKEMCKWAQEYITAIAEKCRDIKKQPLKENIIKVADYMKSHFGEKLLLEDMANYININQSYFSVLFKQYLGKSFSEYLLDIRMNEAKRLLKENNNINEVASRVGYQDIRHFRKMYKQYSENRSDE